MELAVGRKPPMKGEGDREAVEGLGERSRLIFPKSGTGKSKVRGTGLAHYAESTFPKRGGVKRV